MVSRCDPLRLYVEETEGSPSFPGDPVAALPCSRTPGGPPRLTKTALRCCPRYSEHEGSPIQNFFRGSMTRLHGSLPTLNGTIAGYRSKARFRWMVSPFRAGRFPPGLYRNFQSLASSAFSFRFMVSCNERHPRFSGLWLAPPNSILDVTRRWMSWLVRP